MKRVQVIGLPGAGKTTGIETFLSLPRDNEVSILDIRDFDRPNREQKMRQAMSKHPKHFIAESAVGIPHANTYVIKVDTPIQIIYKRLKNRDGHFDPDYLSILTSIMIPAHLIIKEASELSLVLSNIFIN